MYLLALDTFDRTVTRVPLPEPRGRHDPLMLRMRLDPAGHELTIGSTRVDLRKLPPPPPRPAPHPIGIYSHVVGESAAGRPIELLEVGDLSLPGPLLVFGCIHGDECGASALRPLRGGCPDPYLHAYFVPDLDPDGSAAKSRLNARGVDLNRNFGAGWRPIGERGDLEYAGPRPFSEPETRLAARLIRRIQPQVTIWFHQDWGDRAYVRAWGQSVPAARRFAKLAGIEFRLMHWPAGTAPNWQNHRFPGTAAFVVETPRGKLGDSLRERLTAALSSLGEELGEDPGVARRG
jgi:protein MpaA